MTPTDRGAGLYLDQAKLKLAISRFNQAKVLVVGDLMLDHYLQGEVERISPEAPVPVMHVESERHLLGGAGNVAANIAALGGKVELLSAVGDDAPGRALNTLLQQQGIACHLLVEKCRSTTIKTRIIARNQQLVRVDREESGPFSSGTVSAMQTLLSERLADHHVVIVSDYGKGVVSKELMDTLRRQVKGLNPSPVVLVDPKVVNLALYEGLYALTPNAKEAGEMAGLKASGQDGVIKAGLALYKRLRCAKLCITLGEAGLAIFEEPGKVFRVPTVARKVFDVTGAGDTVISALALGLASGLGLLEAGVLANYAAGIVVGQVGTAVATPAELHDALEHQDPPKVEAWLDIQ